MHRPGEVVPSYITDSDISSSALVAPMAFPTGKTRPPQVAAFRRGDIRCRTTFNSFGSQCLTRTDSSSVIKKTVTGGSANSRILMKLSNLRGDMG